MGRRDRVFGLFNLCHKQSHNMQRTAITYKYTQITHPCSRKLTVTSIVREGDGCVRLVHGIFELRNEKEKCQHVKLFKHTEHIFQYNFHQCQNFIGRCAVECAQIITEMLARRHKHTHAVLNRGY